MHLAVKSHLDEHYLISNVMLLFLSLLFALLTARIKTKPVQVSRYSSGGRINKSRINSSIRPVMALGKVNLRTATKDTKVGLISANTANTIEHSLIHEFKHTFIPLSGSSESFPSYYIDKGFGSKKLDAQTPDYVEYINKTQTVSMYSMIEEPLQLENDSVESVDLSKPNANTSLDIVQKIFLKYLQLLVQSPHQHHEELDEKTNSEYMNIVELYLSEKLGKRLENVICHSAFFRSKTGYSNKMHIDAANLRNAFKGHKQRLLPSFARKNISVNLNYNDYEDKMINVWLPLQYEPVINSPLVFIKSKGYTFMDHHPCILDFKDIDAWYFPKMSLGQLFLFDSIKMPHGCVPRQGEEPDRQSIEVRCFFKKE